MNSLLAHANGKGRHRFQVKSMPVASGKRPEADKELENKFLKKASKKMNCWLEGQHFHPLLHS
jgi:hypothetical protein